ncbi:hypothetical protein OEZ86_013719 [Tetradesmus obliquus]|nr:hypothetical protein OEZ86_013719 [Tetradesmus obliquus]
MRQGYCPPRSSLRASCFWIVCGVIAVFTLSSNVNGQGYEPPVSLKFGADSIWQRDQKITQLYSLGKTFGQN